MNKTKWHLVILFINWILIASVVLLFLNRAYPMVGHDYRLAFPQMLDSLLHFRINGLSIQWYTPTFGGGLPAFSNPNNLQFSLLTFFALLVQPLQAVMITASIYIGMGLAASYYLFSRVLKLHWTASILGALFFSANGFIMQRVAVGHLGYQTFPVIAILVITLLDPSIPKAIAGLILSLVVAMLVHIAGYFLIVVFGLAILIILPLVYLYKPALFSWKRILTVLSIGGIVALVLSASKLAAVYAFMRFFPRQIADHYQTSGILAGLFGIVLQLLGTMNLTPLFWAARLDPNLLGGYLISATGAFYGYWEFDMSMSPVVFGIVIIGIYSFLRKPKKYPNLFAVNKKWIAWILLIFFIWLTIEFTLAKGFMYPLLQKLPLLSSLHVNPRFAAAFLFPLALSAAVIYNGWAAKWSGRKSVLLFLAVNLLTLIPLSTYFMIKTDLQDRSYDVTESQEIYSLIRSGDNLTITGIVSNVENTDALLLHQSNLQPYEPIFGYQLDSFHPEIVPGSIWDISDGYYNMTNPSGYVFPELNGTRPFERIPVSEKDKLEAFASHKQPDWKIPLYQRILDWFSGLMVLAGIFTLAFVGIKRLITRFRHRENAVTKA
jgi:hypothetical protein